MFSIVICVIDYTLYHVLSDMIEQPPTFSPEYLYNFYSITNSIFINHWIYFYIFIFFSAMCITFIIALYIEASFFLEEAKNEIIKFYSKGYPHVCIKASSGVLHGKVEDVFNKHLIILNEKEANENGVQKLISWDNVEIIEIKTNYE